MQYSIRTIVLDSGTYYIFLHSVYTGDFLLRLIELDRAHDLSIYLFILDTHGLVLAPQGI